jgi:hypothetical protein
MVFFRVKLLFIFAFNYFSYLLNLLYNLQVFVLRNINYLKF